MEDKKQDVNVLEELSKAADEFRKWAVDFGDKLSKVLDDIQTSKKEDTWEMKCPYKDGEKTWVIYSYGDVDSSFWFHSSEDNARFKSGNIFTTKQAAELEAKRRKLLTRFRAFRDECNNGWKPDWNDVTHKKYYVFYSEIKKDVCVTYIVLDKRFHTFGYFKNGDDAYKAIELFGDEIKELFVDCEG